MSKRFFCPWQHAGMVVMLLVISGEGHAGAAADVLPATALSNAAEPPGPVANTAFVPGPDALVAPQFSGVVRIGQTVMRTAPILVAPVIEGRDARLFPAVTLGFVTVGQTLVPVERGEMVNESATVGAASYWRVIPQFGRIWREPGDGDWSRAAFPLMLVNDTENHAHQGVATFLYKHGMVSELRFQFVQQTAPYLVKPHFVGWGQAAVTLAAVAVVNPDAVRAAAAVELADRLPVQPWNALVRALPPRTLEGFGGPLYDKWTVQRALFTRGTLFVQESPTPYGPFPYPSEMRFGVRSVMKSVAAPLALLRLAQVYGPYVLDLRIGAFVRGLDPKYDRVRFIDAANMASGFGGTGSLRTHPNDIYDGYLGGNYDAWYTAPSMAEKLTRIAADLHPYPWEPGTVVRYRDQDFYLLGVALQEFLQTVRGPQADLWNMLKEEVFLPIGIHHAPAVRTREVGGREGVVWANAGYYPTLDDLTKIARLYQNLGEHQGVQLLHRGLTSELMTASGALPKVTDLAGPRETVGPDAVPLEAYKMGFHFTPYLGREGHKAYLFPTMSGSGENEVVLFPMGTISLRMAKAAQLPEGEKASSDEGPLTIRAVERMKIF